MCVRQGQQYDGTQEGWQRRALMWHGCDRNLGDVSKEATNQAPKWLWSIDSRFQEPICLCQWWLFAGEIPTRKIFCGQKQCAIGNVRHAKTMKKILACFSPWLFVYYCKVWCHWQTFQRPSFCLVRCRVGHQFLKTFSNDKFHRYHERKLD